MNQHNMVDKKQEILAEIDGLRSNVSSNPKIRLRAQAEIFEILDKTVEELDEDISYVTLYKTASKVNMARKRASQAESQEQLLPWLPTGIGLFLSGILGFAAWAIINYKLPLSSVAPESWSMILLGAVLWGMVGSSTDGLRELHTRVARQELDVNRLVWYLAHPLIGAALGGILFFVVYAGLLALTEGVVSYNPALVYALAALAGFGQRQVIQYLRETLANMLHLQKEAPEEGG